MEFADLAVQASREIHRIVYSTLGSRKNFVYLTRHWSYVPRGPGRNGEAHFDHCLLACS